MHIYEVAKDMGVDVKDLSVRIIKVGSELLTEGMRKKLKSAWGEDVLINQDYGMTETMGPGLAYECKCCNGLHLYTKNFIYELVDPKTKEVVNGNTGELVITSLNNECFQIIRYATNDVVELEMDTCCCGCKAPRIKKIIGRCDDMMKIKGVKIFLSQVEDFILRNKHCTSNYVIELTREDYIDCMTINIEYIEEFDLNNINVSRKLEIIINELVEAFKDKFGIKVNFNFVQPNSIPRHTGKVQRIKDLRNKVDF
jgi:phenylacetate-CoA ligase